MGITRGDLCVQEPMICDGLVFPGEMDSELSF